MSEKVLSISIACYNVEKTLRDTLNPLLESNVLDALDVMIIDDGSKDDTADIGREYEKKYPGVFRLIQQQNGGWGATVNTGIREAKGKYFKQLDGDDYYRPENMKSFIECLKNTDSDLVISPYIEYDEATKKILNTVNCNPQSIVKEKLMLKDVGGFAPFMHSLCVRTEILRNGSVAITEHCFYTDTEFVLKACNQASTVLFFDEVIYCYRRASNGQSMSLTGFEKHYMEQYKVIQVLLNYRRKEVTRPEIRRLYDQLLFGTCLWQYLVMLYISPNVKRKIQFIAYDLMLKRLAPDYYAKIDIGNVLMLRKRCYWGFAKAARRQKEEDKRFTEDGRMLY
ncbi:MAG: glycosyltransferase family A protein [Clostridia bacterium]|nr:glycosyltransferase family A protein [Clostridia bacterium]